MELEEQVMFQKRLCDMRGHDVKLGAPGVFDDLTVPAETGNQKVLHRVNRIFSDSESDLVGTGIVGDQICEDIFSVKLTIFNSSVVGIPHQIVHAIRIQIGVHELICDQVRRVPLDDFGNQLDVKSIVTEN